MEIRWIDRNAEGKICGHYACKQRDGQESLPEDHTELLAFDAANKAAMEAAQQAAVDKEKAVTDLTAAVATLTTQLAEAQAKLAKIDKIEADVADLKTATDAK